MFVLNFFQERYPIPKEMTYEVKDNQIGKVIKTLPQPEEGTVDVVRFFETGITCTLATAKEIRDFLSLQIDEIEKNMEIKNANDKSI